LTVTLCNNTNTQSDTGLTSSEININNNSTPVTSMTHELSPITTPVTSVTRQLSPISTLVTSVTRQLLPIFLDIFLEFVSFPVYCFLDMKGKTFVLIHFHLA
jgi:hypothetical protein